MAPPLENRIATALAATDVTSSDLSQLLSEVEAAAVAAEADAAKAREQALDPAVVIDTAAVGAAVTTATLTHDRLQIALSRLQVRLRQAREQENLTAWTAEAAELQERRLALGTEFKKVFSQLIDDIVDRLWEMRDLDQEITALNNRRPIDAANAAGVRFLDFVTPAFAKYLKIPDPEVGEKHWENRDEWDWYLWPPRQLTPGQQMAHAMMASTFPMDSFDWRNWKAKLDERHRRMLEDNRKQIAEAEQRQREREEREAAEARKDQEAERAAYYAKHGWPT